MNKGSKRKARWKKLLMNEIGLHIHVKNTDNVNSVKFFLEVHINVIKSKNKHNDNVKSCLQIDKQCFQDTVSLVDG